MNTVYYLNNRQDAKSSTRVWTAKVTMALAHVVRKTGILPPSNENTLQVILSYLCLEKYQYEEIVGKMDESFRLFVYILSHNKLVFLLLERL